MKTKRVGWGHLSSRTWAPLLGLWAVCVATFGAFWVKWGSIGWSVGSYWWDDLALSGAVAAMNQGLVPTVDFWAPFVLPLYVKQVAQQLVGPVRGYLLECLMQAGLVLILFTALVWGHRQRRGVYWMGAVAVLVALLPFNLTSVAEARLGTVSFSGSYNRLGNGLLTLLFLLPVVQRRSMPTIWLSCFFALAMLLKITVLQTALALVGLLVWVQPGRGWLKCWLMAATGAALLLLPLSWYFDHWQGYFAALKGLSEVRAQVLADRAEFLNYYVYSDHRFELFVYLFIALIFALRGAVLRVDWLRSIVWYLAAVAMGVLFTLTNFGDNGMVPAMSAAYALFAMSDEQFKKSLPELQALPMVRALRSCAIAATLLVGLAYAMLSWRSMDGLIQASGRPQHALQLFPDGGAEPYQIDEEAWSGRMYIESRWASLNLRNPKVYATYAEKFSAALSYLRENYPDRSTSVYALDFPSYVFSYFGGYRVPTGSRPWLLYGHELTLDHVPPASELLADVDILMKSNCSLSGGNRAFLGAIYRVPIERDWEKVAALPCWDVFRSKVRPMHVKGQGRLP